MQVSDLPDLTEKLPLDILAKIFFYCLQKRCGICDRFYAHETRGTNLDAIYNTSRRFRLAWARFISVLQRDRQDYICMYPVMCLQHDIRMTPAIPLYWLVDKTESAIRTEVFELRDSC
jgi:hypothetical protein